MDPLEALAVLGAGLGAGVVITAVGAGSLVSFPILLGVGLSPLVANVSNTVGLVPGGLSGSWGYRLELVGKRKLVWAVAVTSGLGALLGAWALLAFPASAFERVVPWLIILAATLVAVQPLVSRWMTRRARVRGTATGPRGDSLPRSLAAVSTVIGGYGGYFGAGQGVMLVAFLALGLRESLQTVNGLKNVAIVSANVTATMIFVVAAPLDWSVVGLLALGSVVGGWLGAHIGRRLPSSVYRTLVVCSGWLVGLAMLITD